MKKKVFSFLLCLCLLLSLAPMPASAAATITAGGWNETIWAKISGVSDSQITGVSWSGTASGALSGEDLTYLVRDAGDHARIDIPGLCAGTYTLTVTTTSGTLKHSGITVEALDRSGYAHFNYTAGVGAYNDDGTLKKNSIVLYVTEENKNTVSVTSKDGTTVTGIGNILNSVGQDTGSGRNSKGGKANTNADILRKLAADGTPLVVRILGNVTAPAGLTAYNSVDYGGSVGDNGFMARMSGGKDITIEGIGADACINGWGLHFICQTADYAKGYGKSFEVRNIAFRNVPEDCVGMEGQQDGSTLTAPVERCWIHHCTFYAPVIANPAESDKDGGDGACDFKRGQYFTNSYCVYEGYHKTNLVGSSDSSLQYHITYHHNHWKNCESRGPLARQANIHMYNNIFEGQSSYCMSLRANSYIFSEFNLYLNSKQVTDGRAGGICKSYGNSFTSCSGTDNADLVIVTDRGTTVNSNNQYANFDTKSNLSYIPSGKYILQEDLTQMKAVVLSQSGTQKATIRTAAEVNTSVIPTNRYPANAVVLDYSKSLGSSYITAKSGTFDNIIFNVSKTASDCVTLGGSTGGCDIVFYVNTPVNITVTQHSSSANDVVLCNAAGVCIRVGSGTAKNVPAGYYFLQSNNYDAGSGKYKEAKLAALTIQAVDPNAATTPMPDPPVVEPDPGEDPTVPGGDITVTPGSYVHNFTENGKESDFFTISGNLSTSKGSVTFNGLTLTRCLKIESSTSIRFTAPEEGTLILVFGGNTSAAGKRIKVDGAEQTIGSDHILSMTVTAGAHEITKRDSINLFYMVYTSKSAAGSGGEEHTHSYKATVTTAATCTDRGVMTHTCACGDSYTESIPALGHSYGDWVVVKEPTTTENGIRQKTCQLCEETLMEHIPVLDDDSGHVHDYTSEITKVPSCIATGEMTYTCACGASYTQTLSADGHDYTEETVAATCTENGSVTYTCQLCGDSYTETIPAVGSHSFGEGVANEDGSITFTCTLCGYTETELGCGMEDPTEPTTPAEPATPTEPANPTETPAPTESIPNDTQEPAQSNAPWIIAAAVLIVAALTAVILLRKKNHGAE